MSWNWVRTVLTQVTGEEPTRERIDDVKQKLDALSKSIINTGEDLDNAVLKVLEVMVPNWRILPGHVVDRMKDYVADAFMA